MKAQLIGQLHSYLVAHHLDLLIALQEEHRLEPYLDSKVASVRELWEDLQADNRPVYVIEALCLEELTRDLRPSRFNYVQDLLATDFPADYQRMKDSGILAYEVIGLIGACEPIFELFAITGDEKDMRRAVKEMIKEYLNE